jgi:hypothetical protein
VEIEVGADGHASAPPSGAAASAPLVGAFSRLVHVPYATPNLRALAKVEKVVTAHFDGTYTVPSILDIDGLSLTQSKIGIERETQRKYELLHFGNVAQWESFRGAVTSRHLFLHEDQSLPMQPFFHPRFIAADCDHV